MLFAQLKDHLQSAYNSETNDWHGSIVCLQSCSRQICIYIELALSHIGADMSVAMFVFCKLHIKNPCLEI